MGWFERNISVSALLGSVAVVNVPDGKVHGANMGPIWGRQDLGGPHVGPMNFAIWGAAKSQEAGGNFESLPIIIYKKMCL